MIDPLWIHIVLMQVNVVVNSTQPCFMNYSAGADLWKNCGMGSDYMQAAMLPWQWVTGGNFSMVLVSVFVIMSYLKYQKVVYPMIVGLFFLPVAWFLFPTQFLSWAIVMAGAALGLLCTYIYISQTNEQG